VGTHCFLCLDLYTWRRRAKGLIESMDAETQMAPPCWLLLFLPSSWELKLKICVHTDKSPSRYPFFIMEESDLQNEKLSSSPVELGRFLACVFRYRTITPENFILFFLRLKNVGITPLTTASRATCVSGHVLLDLEMGSSWAGNF